MPIKHVPGGFRIYTTRGRPLSKVYESRAAAEQKNKRIEFISQTVKPGLPAQPAGKKG